MADLKPWLMTLGLERYAADFEAAEVDLDTLPHLTSDDLKEIGLPLGPRRRILAALAESCERPPASAPPQLARVPPSAAPATTPERRQITVMFVDLVGSTRLSAEVDPEELATLLGRYKSLVAQEIAAAGGRVAKFLGDGVLAYFGWPQAREDAAESSIRCGFEVIDKVGGLRAPDGQPLTCRIGIATGLVVVGGEAGEGTAREDAIAGEAPNLAARLQGLAGPGAMVISDRTHRQVGQLFECDCLGEHAVAGFAAPVMAWRPLRQAAYASRFRAARTLRTRFIGREHELSLLADRWRTASEGLGRTVLVLGEAGMGKSRLAEALRDRIQTEPHGLATWQCSPYHQNKALYPVIECLKQVAGIVDADEPGTRLEKLGAALASVGAPADGLPLLAHLLAIPPAAGYAPPDIGPNQLRTATIDTLIDWVRRTTSAKPLLLLLEDAHWIDATTLELIVRLVGVAGDMALLILVTARPEFSSPWRGRADVSIIGLDRLNNRDCEGLVRAIAAALSSDTVNEIVSRSDGNPLFLEELSAAVFEAHGASTQSVPDSLQSSLMARLDQLDGAKQTVQVCAVLGRRFATPLLSQVCGEPAEVLESNLSVLVEHDVIRPISAAGEGRFEFKHALLRDAAYESLLLSERRRLHEACGRRLEDAFPEVAQTEPELLAHHFSLARLPREASAYAERAGDRAAAASAYSEANASYEEALQQHELLPGGPESDRRSLALLLKLGTGVAVINGAQDAEVRQIYLRAEKLSDAIGDTQAQFQAVWGLWYNANIGRELDDAAACARQLVVISQRSGDEDHRLEALHCSWSSALFRGECVACIADARQGVELYDRERHHRLGLIFGGHDPGVCAWCVQGAASAQIGDPDASLAAIESGIGLAETLDHPSSLAHAMTNGVITTTILGDPELVRRYADRMLELGRKYNLPPQQAMAAYHLAWVEARAGDMVRGLEEMAGLYERVTRIGPIVLLYKMMYLDQLLRAGWLEDALAAADKIVGELRFPDRGLVLAEIYRLRGDCLAALGRHDEAIPQLIGAEAMARRDGAGLLQLRAAMSLYRARADERSTRTLQAALALFPPDRTSPELVEARGLFS